MSKHTNTQGFTLIEMIVVIALIAILSALAMPSFQQSIVRKQIETALPLAKIAQQPIELNWLIPPHRIVNNNSEAGLPNSDKIVSNYVKSVSIENGAVHILFGNRAHPSISGKMLSLRPAVIDDAAIVPIAWVCGKASAPTNMSVKGANRTSVADDYLPLDCREKK